MLTLAPADGVLQHLAVRCRPNSARGTLRARTHTAVVAGKPVAGNEVVTFSTLETVERQAPMLPGISTGDSSAAQTYMRHQMQSPPAYWSVDLSGKCVAGAMSCRKWMDRDTWLAMLQHLCDKQASPCP